MSYLAKPRSGYTATPTDYVTVLTKNMKDIPVSLLISRNNGPMSIFSPSAVIDPHVKAQIPATMDINTFKRVARVYLTGKDFTNMELEDTKKNIANKEYSEEQVEKKYGFNSNDTLSTALAKTGNNTAVPAAQSPEVLSDAQVIEKIKSRTLRVPGAPLEKYIKRDVVKNPDGTYTSTNLITDLNGAFEAIKTMNPEYKSFEQNPITSITPVVLHFDKNGDLIDQNFSIYAKIDPDKLTFTQRPILYLT